MTKKELRGKFYEEVEKIYPDFWKPLDNPEYGGSDADLLLDALKEKKKMEEGKSDPANLNALYGLLHMRVVKTEEQMDRLLFLLERLTSLLETGLKNDADNDQ